MHMFLYIWKKKYFDPQLFVGVVSRDQQLLQIQKWYIKTVSIKTILFLNILALLAYSQHEPTTQNEAQ